jgi:hypothetical protein
MEKNFSGIPSQVTNQMTSSYKTKFMMKGVTLKKNMFEAGEAVSKH